MTTTPSGPSSASCSRVVAIACWRRATLSRPCNSANLPGRLDLIVLDVEMPLIGGVDLAERLQKKRPLRVLLMSGYPMVLGEGSARRLPGAAFIQKPFTRDELLLKVRQVLGGEA